MTQTCKYLLSLYVLYKFMLLFYRSVSYVDVTTATKCELLLSATTELSEENQTETTTECAKICDDLSCPSVLRDSDCSTSNDESAPNSRNTHSECSTDSTNSSSDYMSCSEDSQSCNVQGKRSPSGVFEVKLVQGLLGLGLTLDSDDLKELVIIKKITMFSPAAMQRELRSVTHTL